MAPHFGLENATVSRALIITCGLCSLARGTLNNVQAPSRIASAFGFSRRIDAVISIFLLFLLGRSVERRRGSRTFGGQIIATAGLSAACRPFLQRASSGYTDGLLAVSIIATLFVSYAVHVPPVQRYSVLNFSITDKVAMYGMGVNLLLNNVQRAVPAAVGIVLGLVYESNPFDIHSLFQLPRYSIRILGGPGDNPVIGYAAASESRPQDGPAAPSTVRQSRAAVQVSQQALEQVAAMGFSESVARAALQQVGGSDVTAAIAVLL